MQTDDRAPASVGALSLLTSMSGKERCAYIRHGSPCCGRDRTESRSHANELMTYFSGNEFRPFSKLYSQVQVMTAESDPFHELDLQQAIDLRWTLRDIKAKRWKLSPINPSHLEKLQAMGMVEMRDDELVLTNAGLDAIS